MNKIKVILADDEESARDVLENLLIRFCPNVEVLAKCENLPQAVEAIKEHQPHVVFLDIEMPNFAGFEIVKFFPEIDFKIVFVTAYDKYAIRAFEVAAMDYLLKPIDIERLKQSVERARKELDNSDRQRTSLPIVQETLESKQINSIIIAERNAQYIIQIADIIAIEADSAYCTVYTTQRNYFISKNLKHFEQLFEEIPHFFRSHKSWLVNLDHLVAYNRGDMTIALTGGIIAQLSRYKKQEFDQILPQ
jgi:two-component system, LytTR family, response regulator